MREAHSAEEIAHGWRQSRDGHKSARAQDRYRHLPRAQSWESRRARPPQESSCPVPEKVETRLPFWKMATSENSRFRLAVSLSRRVYFKNLPRTLFSAILRC